MEEQIEALKFKELPPEESSRLAGLYDNLHEDTFVRVGPKGYLFHKFFLNDARAIYNMQTRPDQVFVGGYPRSGTTWVQQIVWLIMNDLDYETCDKTPMPKRFRFLEYHGMLHENSIKSHISTYNLSKENIEHLMTLYQPVEEVQKRSLLKTHLPLSMLPPKLLETSKMVYVARDPRDTIVSYYHLSRGWIRSFKKDFKTMWNCFRNDELIRCPYFENVKEFWEMRHHPNLLFLFYEDIQNDRLNTLRRVADFFNKSYSEEQLLTTCQYIDFNNLKENRSFNQSYVKENRMVNANAQPFVRKGKVGGWREYFDEEMSREAEQWIADNLRDTDLRFPSIPME